MNNINLAKLEKHVSKMAKYFSQIDQKGRIIG